MMFSVGVRLDSWDESAVKQFVSDWRGDFSDKGLTDLRITMQHFESALLFEGLRLALLLGFLFGQLLAARALVLLNYFVGDLVYDWVLLGIRGVRRKRAGS